MVLSPIAMAKSFNLQFGLKQLRLMALVLSSEH